MTIRLHYFPVRARGETARQILHYAGIPFEDIRIKHGSSEWEPLKDQRSVEWEKLKEKVPFAQLPILEVDGKVLAQSQAINRYLAKKYGLAGKDEWEAALVDQIVELYRDFVGASTPYVFVSIGFMYGDRVTIQPYGQTFQEAIRKEKLIPALRKYGPLFKKALDESGSGFFAKSGPTYADFFLADSFHTLHKLEKQLIETEYPYLLELTNRVFALPQLQSYLATRPDAPI